MRPAGPITPRGLSAKSRRVWRELAPKFSTDWLALIALEDWLRLRDLAQTADELARVDAETFLGSAIQAQAAVVKGWRRLLG